GLSRMLFCLATRAGIWLQRLVLGRGRFAGNDSGFCARQNFWTGQSLHFGLGGRQTSAPRSRSAELYVTASFLGTSVAARSQTIFCPALESIGIRKSKSRLRTRALFVSTMGA